jgi:hypothetical protein
VFENQKHICTVCGHCHKLTAHHKIRRADGGTNALHNLVGVCRACHDQIHGTGPGCKKEAGYPNLVAAASACAAHWAIVTDSWETAQWLDFYERQELRTRLEIGGQEGISYFGWQLLDALQETDPIVT